MDVLVVDDDPDVRSIVSLNLEREGFTVSVAATGKEAIERCHRGPVDLVVLDLCLPDVHGLGLLGSMRAIHPELYVLVLTGAGRESDRVLGLVSGADDYMVKPFSHRELTAKVMAVDRRHRSSAPSLLRFGDIVIDLDARSVVVAGRTVSLTPREFDLLAHLASNPGRTFSRDELLRVVWTSSAEWQQASTVTEHVRRLRSKLERDPEHPTVLVTVRGSGYRFEPEAAGVTPPAASRVVAALDATVVIVGTTIRYASPSMLVLLGATGLDQVVGHDVFEFVAPQSIGATRARHESARAGYWPRPELITIVRVDGGDVLVEVSSAPVVWEGEPASQVTLWHHAGDTQRLRQLAVGISGDVPDALIVTDDELRIQSFNVAAEQLYGWREAEVIGRSLAETIGWEDVSEEIEDLGHSHVESTQRRQDGSEVRVRSSKTVLRDSAGATVGIISVNRPVGRTTVEWSGGDVRDRLLEDAIRAGVSRGEFVVHYQPVVRLETGEMTGVEALVRWQHPERGLLAPAAFMRVAERSGAIDELGAVVLDAAARQVASWRADGHDLSLSVNLSARQLMDASLPDRVAAVMAATGMADAHLWLEVTETALVEDLDQAIGVLHRLSDMGACVSIDDFGTGWASLTYLREFPVHALKIDRVFVAGLGTGTRDDTIVASMVSLGRELDVAVIAEGVEREDQRQVLRRLGCVLAQGYLFGRPQPASAFDLSGSGGEDG